jgi:hypothetical protein
VDYLLITKNTVMQAGYSGTPLLKKLGIKKTDRVLLIHPPEHYLSWLATDISQQLCPKNEKPDFIHLFVKSQLVFEQEMAILTGKMKPTTVIWVSWYKKSSGIATDITETAIRKYALANQLVDIKVCAVSDEWSGLKLVVPVAKRSLLG